MSSPQSEERPAPRPHEHRLSRSDQRIWLERVPDEAATMGLHPYCIDCGAVRSMLPTPGRPTGFFERWVMNLTSILEDHPKYAKMAQVHRHLIVRAVEAVPDFGDPFSMPFDTQRALFLTAVQRVRRDIPLELVEDAMPPEPGRLRPALINFASTMSPKEVRSENRLA